ncbi:MULTISPECIES: MerR family DNA-binding protein [unclassified Fibrobacter]|uniref:MerR family DNA-binding protein n=1 Tax=unclassified Fibrobacter TaxID=2634177 RepID=UPI000D7B00B9|nr:MULTISPECIES: MerR family DNA-binding protein [unclassified Fibrobacter]PWJ61918.1 MerR-like DNA binding protein [Fibrobacter sp. UWR4]PZW67456.1 MerR-like DNA binding protein [Fibrobacter sp. UWR1]
MSECDSWSFECLKDSGLQIKEIRQYIEWFRQRDSTLQQRLELFQNRRKALEAEMARMQTVMNKITFKETLYTTALKLGSLAAADNDKTIMRLKKSSLTLRMILTRKSPANHFTDK